MTEIEALRAVVGQVLRCDGEAPAVDFYLSSLVCPDTAPVIDWLSELNATHPFEVEEIGLSQLRRWHREPGTGNLVHESGQFFAIRGLEVETNFGPVPRWSQPIIDQPQIGLLGLLTQRRDGLLHVLVQAKAEPGNLNTFQLSPSVQATRSNFTRVHGGAATPLLEYFFDHPHATVLVDQLQSEQGARFYRKRNRNMVVRLPDELKLDVGPLFRWVTLGQLHRLIRRDNTLNMDLRSVMSCISINPPRRTALGRIDLEPLSAFAAQSALVGAPLSALGRAVALSEQSTSGAYHTIDALFHTITREKFLAELRTQLIPLARVEQWRVDQDIIAHDSGRYFEVLGVRIRSNSREVPHWDQPIIRQRHTGLVAFVGKQLDGVLHLLVQLKMECGNHDLLELAPTVQCITDNYGLEARPAFVNEVLGVAPGLSPVIDALQSEEGGRFYRETNRNLVCLSAPDAVADEPKRFVWMTLAQLKWFVRFNNFLNVEARSLLAGLSLE